MAKKSEPSFFEKLKKGMGIEIPSEEIEEKEEETKKPELEKEIEELEEIEVKKEKKVKAKKSPKKKVLRKKRIEMKSEKIEEKPMELEKPKEKEERKEKEWFQPEGQLSVDVYQTKDELVIQSAIAGIKPEDLDISLQGDVVSIRGVRERPFKEEGDYFTQECYWGPFSREIILPVEIDPKGAEASMKNGILTIRIPKILRGKKRKIIVKKISE